VTRLFKHMNSRIHWLIVADIFSVCLAAFGWLIIRFDVFEVPMEFVELTLIYLIPDVLITLLVFYAFKLYHSVWRFASLDEILTLLFSVLIIDVVQVLYKQLVLASVTMSVPWSFFFIYPMLLFFFASLSRMSVRIIRRYRQPEEAGYAKRNTLVVGAGAAAHMLINELMLNPSAENKIVCIVDDSQNKRGKYIHGIKIVGGRKQIPEMVKKYNVEEIIIAIPSAGPKTISDIVEICYQTKCRVKRLPSIAHVAEGKLSTNIKDVSYVDLLSRKPINSNHPGLREALEGRTILVTGGGGSIGAELCRQIASYHPKQLIILDVYENGAYNLQMQLARNHPELDVHVLIGSVRDYNRLEAIFETYRPELVYHAAAHKHVPLMEESPGEAIKNNCMGTLNLCQLADKYGVYGFLLVSTDKAVRPTNIMGATKRICEMIVQYYAGKSQTRFVAVRFGNVLGSEGSVVPLFFKQIEQGGPVTVTHKDITRFFMTIPEAVSLILETALMAKGGEIFILDMGKQVRIYDMAEKLIQMKGLRPGIDIKIEITGLRPGEKLYEELLLEEEGISKTNNEQIFIGRPIEFDREHFLLQLEALILAAKENNPRLKEMAGNVCCTYVITENKED
jgi:FlaA1/EpsC-like NDP-sugar epimerase